MSRDKSLKSASSLSSHRNVLTRMERIEKLKEEERWIDGTPPFALPKVAHRMVSVGGKDKKVAKKEEETAATPEGEADAKDAKKD